MRVLLVAVDPDVQALTAASLEGHEVVDGPIDGAPDVALVGLEPGVDAPRVVEALRDDPATGDVAIVLLCATREVPAALERRVDALLVRPFTPRDLVDVVDAVTSAPPDQRRQLREGDVRRTLLRDLRGGD